MIGVVENMSGFTCPKCGEITHVFKTGGGEQMAADMSIPFLGRIPLNPRIALAGDSGAAFADQDAETGSARAFDPIAEAVLALPARTAPQPQGETP